LSWSRRCRNRFKPEAMRSACDAGHTSPPVAVAAVDTHLGRTMDLMPESDAFNRAIAQLPTNDTFRSGRREYRVLFLIPESLWRPLRVEWWTGKEVCIIGGDPNGNYFLRAADGSVRLWNHSVGAAEILAPSVREFVGSLRSRES
jgi:hypothetical protein